MKLKMMVAAAAAALIGTAMPAPAQAAAPYPCTGEKCISMYHQWDRGYDASFTLRCSQGSTIYVPENRSSSTQCVDVTNIYVHANEEFWCVGDSNVWFKWVDAPGWHGISEAGNRDKVCEVRRD